jgi:chaperonin cofactor prefoldin
VLRDNLGRQLDEQSVHHLRARIDELTVANETLQNQNRALTAERGELQAALHAAEDDLAAVRTSLRRMIREQTSELA